MNRDLIEHEPVLAEPVMSIIAPRPGEVVVDATLGHGGHSRMIAGAIGPAGRLIALDVDERNIARARDRIPVGPSAPAPSGQGPATGPSAASEFPRVDIYRANFAELDAVMDAVGFWRTWA